MAFLPTNASQVQAFAGALYGIQVGTATMAQVNADITAAGGLNNALNAYYTYSFGTSSVKTVGDLVAANLGLTGAAATSASTYIQGQLTGNTAKGGQIIASILGLFAGLTADATYGTAATAWNTKVSNAILYAGTSDVAAGTPVTGSTFTLTTGADVLNTVNTTAANRTTSGDDIIYGIADGTLTSTDVIDAGDGNDTINAGATAASQTLAPVLTSVETVTITHVATDGKSLTFDATNASGLTTINIKNAGAASAAYTGAASDEVINLSALPKTATVGIIGGTSGTYDAGGTGTGSQIKPVFTGAAAADTQKIAISTKGQTADLILATAETVEITATGTGTTGANTIGKLTAAAKTLNIKGTGDLTISASDLAGTSTAAATINASTATGKISFAGESGSKHVFTGGSGDTTVTMSGTADDSITTGAGNDTITTSTGNDTVVAGAGNDRVIVGAQTDVTALDSIDGGDGTDTIVISDATVNATTKTELAKGSKGFEVVETTAATLATIDLQALSSYDTVKVTAAMAAAMFGTAAKAGTNSVTAVMENPDVLYIANARAGQNGGVTSTATKSTAAGLAAAGGHGIAISPYLDSGSNAVKLVFVGNADVNGGAGECSKGGAGTDIGGTGGDALNAPNIETLNIVIQGTQASTGTADTVTFTAGAAGADGTGGTKGSAGNTVVVGTNATINLTSELDPLTATAAKHNHVDFGTIKGTNVTLNGASFLGNVAVTAGDGNVTLITGAGTDTVVGGTGADTLSTGAGADSITNTPDGANTTANDQITTGAGFDTVTLIGSAASASNYNAAPVILDFTVGDRSDNTDLIKLSSTNASYSAGLSVDGSAAGASGTVGIFTLAQNATYDSGSSTTNEFLKLTTGVAFTTSLQATFNAAIGSGTVTNLTQGTYAGCLYDTTNSKMVIFEVTTDNTTTTTIETGDVVRLIGTINMTAADYALIDTDNFASML